MDVCSPDRLFSEVKSRVILYTSSSGESSNALQPKLIQSTSSGHLARSLAEAEEEEEEILFKEDPNRFSLFPIRFPDMWKAYKDHKNSFWTAEEIDFSADKADWEKLNKEERFFLEHILAFFAGSDGIVLENLMKNFCSEVMIPEARCFYSFQAMMENIHAESYALMIETLVADPARKAKLFDAITEIPCVQKKAEWAVRWINDKKSSFAKRLFAFGIVEGLFFSGSFCAIFWLKERGLMTQALGKSNEWIARDESLHTEFAILLYSYLKKKITECEAHFIMHQAVTIEEEFICESLPVKLIGMNHEMMRQYIRFCADRLLTQFGYAKIYFDKNPFPFMEKISMDGKTNFFEQRVSEYSMASLPVQNDTMFALEDLDADEF